jgi:hypothetical protein
MAIIGRVLAVSIGLVGLSMVGEAAYNAAQPAVSDAADSSTFARAVDTGLEAARKVFSLAAVADEWVGDSERIDLSNLVRFGIPGYDVSYDASVDGHVQASSIIKKIGYGNVEYVSIATTSTGVYSTDGLASPHVLYPGIDVAKSGPEFGTGNLAVMWQPGAGWMVVPWSGDSFYSVRSTTDSGNRVSTNSLRSCVSTGSGSYCVYR